MKNKEKKKINFAEKTILRIIFWKAGNSKNLVFRAQVAKLIFTFFKFS